ncbi:MAG: putative repeat protein (TIGR01451 family), partial [Myxococcota bacterium]
MRTSALLAAVFFVASLATANAAPVFDANQGSWSDQYFDSAGIAPASSGLTADVVHEASARQVRLVSGFASGQLGTTVIAPTSFSAWGGVYTQASIPAGAALDLFVLDQATGTLYGDAGATGTLAAPPVPLSAGPSDRTGFSARYDVSAIPVSVDNAQIIVKFTAVTINVGDPDEAILSPALDALAISWTPRSVVDLRLSAPASVGAGSTIAYRLNAAISFVNATDLVVTLPLPTATANPENQNQSVTFVSANAGGTLNAAGDAIVWDLGQRSAGDTFVLLANVRTRIGLLDGTIYQTTAAVTASNADGAVAGPVSAAIVSNPNPWLNNRSFGNTYLLENQERAFSGSTITVRASGGNWRIVASSGAETLFDSVVYDDVSSLIDTPGALGPNGVHNISHLGMYTDVAIDLANGRTIPAKSVYWMPGDLTPGQGFNFSYDVQFGEETGDGGTLAGDEVFSFCDYVGGATVPQTADWRGPVCKTVKLGVPVDPNGTIALGEAIRGFRRVSSAQDLVGNPRVEAGFGDTVSYPMYIVNQGISALDDIIMFNEVPPEVGFVSAFLPASAAGSIHYYTGPISPGVPPDFTDTDGTLGTLWLDAAPVDPSTVTWVAFRVAKLSSRFDAAPTAPVSVTAEIDVVIPPPVGDCPDRATIDDYMYAFIYGFTPPNDSTPTVISPPWTGTNHEETVVVADKPNLSASSVGANTSVVTGGDTLTYTVRLQNRNVGNVNTPLDTALNSSVEINLPAVAIDGVPGYLPVVSVTAPGGSISYNLPTGVTVTYPAPVPVNDSRTISLSVQIPPGIVDGTGFSLSAAFTADDDICGSVAASAARSVSYAGVPALSVGKSIDLAYGQVGTVVTYSLDYSNTSVSPSTRSWVVDAIAPQLELQLAQVPPGGAVWFSNAGPPTLPATLDALDSFDETRVLANFTQAVDADGDGWVETPFGAATSYVAFLVDNAALTPAQLPSMRGASVSFTAVVSSGEIGSVVTNEAAIFSSELIQAIGNKSLFTITGQPGLRTLADCPAIVSATESYDFVVDYYNDSANNDASAMVTLTVPDGVTVGGATHTYNDAYLTANPTPPVITPTVDGQVVTVSVGALAPLEGGSVTLSLTPDPATESGTFLVPNALGVAVGDDGDTQSSYTECSTSVENADLFLRILVDNPTPRAGQVFNATLLVSNEGAHDALESLIDSVLPEGLSLVPGTAIITPFPWTMTSSAQPSQVGDTLLWTAGTDNGITYDDREPGTMPGLSGVASIVFSLVVDDGSAGGTDLVLPGTTLEICGAISTETGEDGNFPNHGCETVTTPLPDPWVGLSAPAVRRPNDRATFTLSYGNNNNEIAGGVVAIFTVPDGPAPDADGTPDLVYTGHQATNGETTWFHSVGGPAPAFDPADPAAGGWSQTPDLTIGVAHVAFFAGDLAPYAGPYSVTIDLLMQGLGDPPAPVFPGSQFDGTATVVMTTSGFGDANVDNNSATATTRVPGIDLALDKDATPRGAFPGVLPGDLVVWTMTVTNSGTVDAHGVRVSDALPPELELVSPPAELIVESSAGVASQPVDALGNPYITPVSWVADGAGNYYMGDNSAGVNPGDYRRLGLAPGDSAVLQLTTRVRDAVPDSTVVLNTATVVTDYVLGWMDGDPVESPELLGNNTDSVSVTVYLPNVCITVSVVDSTNGSTALADVGDTLTYTLEYSNPGNFEAENVIIEDAIPDGASFIVGSLSGLDPDAVAVHYSDDGGATFDYVPAGITGSRDGDVTHIQVRWNEPLTAPAGAIFVQDTAADFAEGTHVNTTPLPALGGLAGTGGNICDDVECQDVACETGLTYVPDGECCPVCAPTVPGCADGTPHAAAECSELAFNGSWTGCLPAADSCNIECFGGWTDIPDASDASDVCRDTYAWAAGAIEECAAANPEDLTACEYIKCGPTAEPGSACPDAEPLWDTCWRAEAGACPDVQAYQCANWQYVDACGWTYQGGLNSYIGCIQAVPAGSESFCDWLKPSDDCSPCATQICNNTDPELLTSSSTAWWLSDYLVDPLVKLGVVLGERGLSVPADLMPGNPYQACSGPRSCSVEGSGSACVVPCGQFQDCQICDKQGLVCAVCPGGDFIGDIQLGVSIDQGGATIGSCESNAAYIKGLWDECEEERLVFGGADDFCDFTKPPECSRAECERQCFTSPVFPAEGEGTILEWNFAAINDAVDESSSIAYSVLDPATGLPIDGLADLPSPGDGAIDLSGLSPDDHQQLQLSACFNGTPSPTNCVDIISPPKACPEYYYSGYPYHIHDNGTVVGGYGRFDPECRFESQPPFVWTEATGFHYIDAPDGEEEVTWGYAQMSNAAGAVVGVTGVYDGEVQRDLMFYWTPEGGTQEIPAPEQVSSAYQCHFATESLVACSFRGESGYQLLAWNVGSDTSYAVGAAQRSGDRVDVDSAGRLYFATDFGSAFLDGDGMTVVQTGAARWDPMLGREELDISGAACQGTSNWIANVDEDDTYYGACRGPQRWGFTWTENGGASRIAVEGLNREADLYDANDAGVSVGRVVNGISQITALYRLKDGTILDVPTPDGFTGMEFWSVGENGDASVWLLGGDGTSTGIYHPST